MIRTGPGRAALLLGFILVATAPAATEVREGPSPLSALQPGLWVLRDIGDSRVPPRALCIADPQVLFQIEHRGSPCSRLVVGKDSRSVTVHYTCPADGFGLTSILVETPALAKVDTQGIKDSRPFAYRLEARRLRGCGR
ncbi:MAG TPA: hypothetical protein VGR19_06160 [Allosphingosinicella sp.]|nr:hypothetical protein [Allosphingosinicella sp.]